MLKCQYCRDEKGDYLCKHDVVGTPREDQEIIGYSEVKARLLQLVRDSFQRSKDPNFVANLSAALIGDFGMGKSAIAHFFVNAIENNDYDLLLVNLQEDGVSEEELQHLDWQQMATYRGTAIRIDARTVADQLQPGQVTDYITPFFRKIGDEFGISRKLTSVKDITKAILKKKEATRLFIFIDEMEGLKETQYGLNFNEFFARFTNDLRTLINGEGAYDIRNCITIILCTVPSVWEEFKRREDSAGGLLTREYSEPFVLQRFDLAQSYRFVERVCRSWKHSPFTERCIRTLHLAADGKPRLLTKLCKHVEGSLPVGDARSTESYNLAALTATALTKAVGSLEQFTYAFDLTSFNSIYEYLDREYSSDHARLFRLLAMQYDEYTDEDLAEALELEITRAQEIARALSSEERLVLGLRLVSRGHLFDYAALATDKVPRAMIDQNFMKSEDIDFSLATGEITVFGKLDYFKQILNQLTAEALEGNKKVFVPFHKEDLALLWNLSEEQADSLGKGLRGCALQRTDVRYRISEAARNRIFPVASQADLPFLSKERYYQLRTATNNLSPEERNAHMVGGVMKLLEYRGFEIQERTSAYSFDFEIDAEKLRELFHDFNDDLSVMGRVLVIDSAETFDEEKLVERLQECDFGLLICIRNFGDNRILRLPPRDEIDETFGPFRPTIAMVIQSTRLETNLLILSQVTQGDIAVEIEYQPTLKRLYRELRLDSFPQAWHELGAQSGICLKEWQMRRGASKKNARKTLSDLIQVIPSLPMSLEKAIDVTQKELGFPPTALPTWAGIDDLVDLGFVSRRGQRYDVDLSSTEEAIWEIVEYLRIDTSSYTSISEGIVDKIKDFFWNLTSNPKAEELCDYVELLREKGLLIHRTEQEVKQRALDFKRLYAEAGTEDKHGSSIKQYCDTWTRAKKKRGLDGINRSFAYFFKNYQNLLEMAARPEETRRLSYCASALFAAYDDLSTLYQEGESRYKSVKKRLDDAEEHKRTTQEESKIVVRNTDATLEIRGETDKTWQTINKAFAEMTRLHQDGTTDEDIEKVVEQSEKIKSKCEQLQETYRRMKTTFQELQSRYKEVHELAQRASQSPYRDQVKQELQDVNELDPEKQIPDLLNRYRESGRAAGDSGVQGYQDKLDGLAQIFDNFLAQHDKLQKLTELQQDVEQFVSQVEEHTESLNSLKIPVEGIERLDNVPLFFRSVLDTMRKDAQDLLSTVQSKRAKFALQNTAEIDSLSEQLAELQSNLITDEENQDTFTEYIRQINYNLRTIFSPLSFHCLEATYEKFLGDFRFQLQKRMQETYRAKTYEDAEESYEKANEYVAQAEQCLKEIGDLDGWFDQLGRAFDVSKFEGTSVQDRVVELAQQIEGLEKKLLQRFPRDIGKALKLLKKVQEDDQPLVDETLSKLKSLAKKECTDRIDEARRVVERFERSLSPIRAQIHRMLDKAAVQWNEGDFAQSLNTTRQAVDKVVGHLEQTQGSQSVRIQVTLLSQPGLHFSELVRAYEQRFGDQFDEEAVGELVRLLKEGKLHGTFSI